MSGILTAIAIAAEKLQLEKQRGPRKLASSVWLTVNGAQGEDGTAGLVVA
jgi:hypothetical protein